MRRVLLAVAMCGAVTGASAADMPDLPILRGGFTDGLTRSRVNWEGMYVGGQVSYGAVTSKQPATINSDLQSTFIPPVGVTYNWQPLGNAYGDNGGLGAFIGYNSQWDEVVVGFEANYNHDGLVASTNSSGLTFAPDNVTITSTANSNATVKLSDFGSLRLRAGYAIDSFLPYAFVSGGVGVQTVDRFVTASPAPVNQPLSHDSTSKLVFGYGAGIGFDVMLVGGLFARAEYEYRRVTTDIESNVNAARLGLGYKF